MRKAATLQPPLYSDVSASGCFPPLICAIARAPCRLVRERACLLRAMRETAMQWTAGPKQRTQLPRCHSRCHLDAGVRTSDKSGLSGAPGYLIFDPAPRDCGRAVPCSRERAQLLAAAPRPRGFERAFSHACLLRWCRSACYADVLATLTPWPDHHVTFVPRRSLPTTCDLAPALPLSLPTSDSHSNYRARTTG